MRSLIQVLALSGVALAGCGGASHRPSGDQAGQINTRLSIRPANPALAQGQTIQFTAVSPWGGGANWSVVPASGGRIGADGQFTAAAVEGTFTIVAMWKNDVRYTATTAVRISALPSNTSSADLVPNLSGTAQANPGKALENSLLAGGATPSFWMEDAHHATQLRPGFDPVVGPKP